MSTSQRILHSPHNPDFEPLVKATARLLNKPIDEVRSEIARNLAAGKKYDILVHDNDVLAGALRDNDSDPVP